MVHKELSIGTVGSWMVAPRTSDPNPWKPVNVTLIGKRTFEDVTQLRIMKWEIILGYPVVLQLPPQVSS